MVQREKAIICAQQAFMLLGHCQIRMNLTSIKVKRKFVQNVFAGVGWHKPDDHTNQFGKPTKIWKLNELLLFGPSNFLLICHSGKISGK